jgi:hypothetical protein
LVGIAPPAFQVYISELVVQEAAAGDALLAKRRLRFLADIPILAANSGYLIQRKMIVHGPIPRKEAGDAARRQCRTASGATTR